MGIFVKKNIFIVIAIRNAREIDPAVASDAVVIMTIAIVVEQIYEMSRREQSTHTIRLKH